MTFFICGLKPGTRNPVTPSEPSRKTTVVQTVGSVARWFVGLPVQQLENRRFCDWKTAVHLTVAVKIDWSWDCFLTYDIHQLFMMSLELYHLDMFFNSFRPLVWTSKWPVHFIESIPMWTAQMNERGRRPLDAHEAGRSQKFWAKIQGCTVLRVKNEQSGRSHVTPIQKWLFFYFQGRLSS